MKTAFRNAAILMVLAITSACTTLGVPKAETFNQRLAVAYSSVTTARDTVAVLLNNDALTASDGQNLRDTINQVRSGLDVAANLYKVKPSSGEDKLVATLRILREVDKYLNGVQR